MSKPGWVRAGLAAATILALGSGLTGAAPSTVSASAPRGALGACWLTNVGFGLGEDTSAVDYITRWYGGSVQTLIHGSVPRARYWSLTIYHARRGSMITYYDQQVMQQAQAGTFTLAIGGKKPHGKALWVDPTTGGDAEGYLFYRLYLPSGHVALPSVTYASSGALPSTLSSCASMTADLRSALVKANAARPGNGKTSTTVGQTAKQKLWPNNVSPFRAWSVTVNPLLSVSGDVTKVPLITQLADPNVVYHAVFFNLSWGDMVLHGTLAPVSSRAPAAGVRYVSMCAYPNDESHRPLACLNDTALKVRAHGEYTVVVSPDQPTDTSNWINPGDTTVGALILRWVLPQRGSAANLCLPSLDYRQPGDTLVPPLPHGC